MFQFRSKLLFISVLLATFYMFYVTNYYFNVGPESETSKMLFHILAFALGLIMHWVGVCINEAWAATVSMFLYLLASMLYFNNSLMVQPMVVLNFFSIKHIYKINKSRVIL